MRRRGVRGHAGRHNSRAAWYPDGEGSLPNGRAPTLRLSGLHQAPEIVDAAGRRLSSLPASPMDAATAGGPPANANCACSVSSGHSSREAAAICTIKDIGTDSPVAAKWRS